MPRPPLFPVKLILFFSFLLLSSCATPSKIQSQLRAFALQNEYRKAKALLNDNPSLYGRNNSLLYLLDKGLILHLSNDYARSIDVFEKAKARFDELYTKSVTGIVSTWLINEYTAVYRGEDFERVMINIFQALNYLFIGNLEEALVEARDVDVKLTAINSRYTPHEKNVYKEDAFARLLMGILYEASNTPEGFNNAFISYVKALEVYENDYVKNYRLYAPEILKENVVSLAAWMGKDELNSYQSKYKRAAFLSLAERAKKAEVYLIQYDGVSPVKEEEMLFVGLPEGHIFKLAFPQYKRKSLEARTAVLGAKEEKNNKIFKARTQEAQDIGALAVKNLENKRARVVAKAVASATGKYFLERKQEENIRKTLGGKAADGFKIASNLFNVYSSKADVRGWYTLPSEIRIARLFLEPGEYVFFADTQDARGNHIKTVDLGKTKVAAGQKKFFLIRT